MSRHAGIDRKENTFDISEHNLADKKYVDEKDNLRLELTGGAMTRPLGMSGGKIWDLGTPTLNSNATNKKYVDDKITTLTSTVNNKISDVDVVDNSFTVGADSQIRVVSATVKPIKISCYHHTFRILWKSIFICRTAEKQQDLLSLVGKQLLFGVDLIVLMGESLMR